jgi:hypothetical protein
MKAKVVTAGDATEIFISDGGNATIWHNGEHMVTQYYQSRLTEFNFDTCENDEHDWEELSEGKAYMKDWEKDQELTEEMITDAIGWLVCFEEITEIIKIEGECHGKKNNPNYVPPKIRPIYNMQTLQFGVFLTYPNGKEERVYFTKQLPNAQLWIGSDKGKKIIKQFYAIAGEKSK